MKLNERKLAILLVLCSMIGACLLFPILPEQVPMQFSFNGTVNYTLSKNIVAPCIPIVMALICFYLDYTQRLTKKQLLLLAFVLVCFLVFLTFLSQIFA